MHYAAYEFPRISIPRTRVNKEKKKKGRGLLGTPAEKHLCDLPPPVAVFYEPVAPISPSSGGRRLQARLLKERLWVCLRYSTSPHRFRPR
jgi:hypothetical protein